jgi:hypothetical protein
MEFVFFFFLHVQLANKMGLTVVVVGHSVSYTGNKLDGAQMAGGDILVSRSNEFLHDKISVM